MINELNLFDLENNDRDTNNIKYEIKKLEKMKHEIRELDFQTDQLKLLSSEMENASEYMDKWRRLYLIALLWFTTIWIFTTVGQIITPGSSILGAALSGFFGSAVVHGGRIYMGKNNLSLSKYRHFKNILKSNNFEDIKRQIEEKERQKDLLKLKFESFELSKMHEQLSNKSVQNTNETNIRALEEQIVDMGINKYMPEVVVTLRALNESEVKPITNSNIFEKNIMDNNFIQIVYDGKLYNVPLDQQILLGIKQQDDIEITFNNGYIVRKSEDSKTTFDINNALRRAYLSSLYKLNISDDLRKYIEKYDRYIEYIDETSVTSIKTIVNELAYIYYAEYTNKCNNIDLTIEPMNKVHLDKGFCKKLVKGGKTI